MDPGAVDWARLPAARQAAAARDFGTLIRLARVAQGLTLAEAGRRVGYSAATLSRLERGLQPLTDLIVLRRLAEAFNVPVAMFGLAQARCVVPHSAGPAARVPERTAGKDGDEPVRRRALLSGLVTVASAAASASTPTRADPRPTPTLDDLLTAGHRPGAPPIPTSQLNLRLAAGRHAFHQCRYADIVADLPAVITGVISSRDRAVGRARDHLNDLLAGCYRLGSEVCIKLHDDAIGWVLADRAVTAAGNSGNPVSVAESTRCAAVAMRRAGHHNGAIDLLTGTARSLDAHARGATASQIAAYGAMLCTAAYSSAQHGNGSLAVDLIEEADEAATLLKRTGPAVDNPFNAVNVAIYKIAIYTTLGDTGAALRHASGIEVRRLPTPERRGRYLLDTARAWARHGSPDDAYVAILAAEHHAPQELRRPSARNLVAQLLLAPTSTPTGLRDLAARIGALPG